MPFKVRLEERALLGDYEIGLLPGVCAICGSTECGRGGITTRDRPVLGAPMAEWDAWKKAQLGPHPVPAPERIYDADGTLLYAEGVPMPRREAIERGLIQPDSDPQAETEIR